ncbi:MAG TPA: hypothetical protein PKE65_07685, partial [Rhizobiaceae bacterium]|nr:hypothetical protein [Rhizobiaceae bacterium]
MHGFVIARQHPHTVSGGTAKEGQSGLDSVVAAPILSSLKIGDDAMRLANGFLAAFGAAAWFGLASGADAQETPPVSQCMAIAQALPSSTFARFDPAQAPVVTRAQAAGDPWTVRITYAGHSTYLIDTPAGVRIATDFSG